MSVRMATVNDAAAIARVHVDSWRTTYAGIVPDDFLAGLSYASREQRWRELLSGVSVAWVAEADGAVVGFAAGGANREPDG